MSSLPGLPTVETATWWYCISNIQLWHILPGRKRTRHDCITNRLIHGGPMLSQRLSQRLKEWRTRGYHGHIESVFEAQTQKVKVLDIQPYFDQSFGGKRGKREEVPTSQCILFYGTQLSFTSVAAGVRIVLS